MSTIEQKQVSKLSWLAMSLSLLCAIHCLMLPVLITAMPLMSGIFENHLIEWAIIGSGLILGGWTIWMGARDFHNKKWIPIAFSIGFLLILGHTAVHSHELWVTFAFLVPGTLLVGGAQLANYRLVRKHKCGKNCHHH